MVKRHISRLKEHIPKIKTALFWGIMFVLFWWGLKHAVHGTAHSLNVNTEMWLGGPKVSTPPPKE